MCESSANASRGQQTGNANKEHDQGSGRPSGIELANLTRMQFPAITRQAKLRRRSPP